MRILFLSLLALMMLFIGACFSDAEIIVKNNSTILRVSSPRMANLSYSGRHILPGNIQIEVQGMSTQHVSLEPNCGSLRLQNSGPREIRSLQVSEAGNNSWSENLLDSYISTGQYEYFSLSRGFYDLRIRDSHNNYFYMTAIPIDIDHTTSRSFFSGSK